MKRSVSLVMAIIVCFMMLASCGSSGKRTSITELEWEKLKAGNFENYSGVKRVNNTIHGENTMTFWIDGEQWRDRAVQNGALVSQRGQFLIDGELVYCIYDLETEKWVKQDENKSPFAYPYKDIRYEFSKFEYNEKKGNYVYTLEDEQFGFPQDAIESGDADMIFRFEDGKCVYSKAPQYLMGIGSISIAEIELFDYGTTKVPVPDLKDIVEPSNNK